MLYPTRRWNETGIFDGTIGRFQFGATFLRRRSFFSFYFNNDCAYSPLAKVFILYGVVAESLQGLNLRLHNLKVESILQENFVSYI